LALADDRQEQELHMLAVVVAHRREVVVEHMREVVVAHRREVVVVHRLEAVEVHRLEVEEGCNLVWESSRLFLHQRSLPMWPHLQA
jgi:hypothetical protein